MLPTSLVVVIATVSMSLAPALLLFWSWRRGLFHDLELQSRMIFDERDWRLERPWESFAEQRTREVLYGRRENPKAGEWGGATSGPIDVDDDAAGLRRKITASDEYGSTADDWRDTSRHDRA